MALPLLRWRILAPQHLHRFSASISEAVDLHIHMEPILNYTVSNFIPWSLRLPSLCQTIQQHRLQKRCNLTCCAGPSSVLCTCCLAMSSYLGCNSNALDDFPPVSQLHFLRFKEYSLLGNKTVKVEPIIRIKDTFREISCSLQKGWNGWNSCSPGSNNGICLGRPQFDLKDRARVAAIEKSRYQTKPV